MVFVVAALGLLLTLEGIRLRANPLIAGGTAVVMAAVLFGIAVARPGNPQAYTLPAGVYLIGLGLAFRRSRALLAEHMDLNELAFISGAVLPRCPLLFKALAPRHRATCSSWSCSASSSLASDLPYRAAGLWPPEY